VTVSACGVLAAVIGLAATTSLVLAGAVAAQAPAVAPPEVTPPASGPEPLWVPDPEPAAERVERPQAPVPDVAAVSAAAPAPPAVTDASQIAIAHWMAEGARAAGLPGELPVMAALTESGLRNLPYGDRDSVGYFQMRTGIWDRGVYEGYLARPELQLRWFVDHALAVRAARVAGGDEDFGGDPSTWGEWIADVERPAGIYRGRYQQRLGAARALLAQPAPALAPFELALTVDGAPVASAGPVTDPLVTRALTEPNIELSDRARDDLLAGRIDPRLVAVLLQAAERAPIAVTVFQTGHSLLTVNGSVSNHSLGRGADISHVGGRPVSRRNTAARELALALGELPRSIRPTEIGTPWAIADAAYFTDSGHLDHLHVGFDDPVTATVASDAASVAVVDAPVAEPAPPPRPGLQSAEPRFEAGGPAGASTRRERGARSEPAFDPVEVDP
jgi:hypothetical protein